MARAPDKSSAEQFNVADYTSSWAANNPYYAAHVTWGFDTTDTTRGALGGPSQSALKSGIVQVASYSNIHPEASGKSASDPLNWANPRHSSNVPYDRFGNVKKQAGDVNLGLVLMGGYQFPGQAFGYKQTQTRGFVPDGMSLWMLEQGMAGYSPSGLRSRKYGDRFRDKGWQATLTRSTTSNKGPGGYGQSSEDSTMEMYSTRETRLGKSVHFTDEEFDEETKKFGRSWAGYRRLASHGSNPHYDSSLGQMFVRGNVNVGEARRVATSRL